MVVLLPLCRILKRCLSVLALVVLKFRKNKRKFIIIKHMNFSIFKVYNRNRLAPVSLSCKNPLTEMVICFLAGHTHLNKLIRNGSLGFLNSKSRKLF